MMKVNFRRITAVILILAVIASVTCLLNVFAGNDGGVDNYPALRNYTEGTVPSGSEWSYFLANYGEKPNFSKTTDGFFAPTADYDADNSKTAFTWQAYGAAAYYGFIVAKGNGTAISETGITELSFTTSALSGGIAYEAQVTAYDADGKPLAYSAVDKFNTDDGNEGNNAYSFDPFDMGISEAGTYIKSSKLITDDDTQKSGYIFQNSNSRRRIVWQATGTASEKLGAYAVFTAPADAIYDISASFGVVDNSKITDAMAYFRILKIDNNGDTSVISPYDTSVSEWYSASVTSDDKNPVTEIFSPQTTLKKDERVIIQAYADVATGSTLKILLGNPNATVVEKITDYKGVSTIYPLKNYVPHYSYDGTIANNALHKTNGRWSAKLLCCRDDKITYTDFTVFNGWGMEATNGLKNSAASSSGIVGYYWYPSNPNKNPSIQSGLNGYGVAFDFTAPESGYASLSATIGANKNGAAYYRVLKNGKKLLPADGEWVEIAKGQDNYDISAGSEVEPGDVISLEVYSNIDNTQINGMPNPPTVSISNGNTSNAVSDTSFSPLWERPYSTGDYVGEFTELSGSVWSFDILNAENTASLKTLDANEYNSGEAFLYNNTLTDVGYVFSAKQLKFKFADKYGMALTYKAPSRGYYDFATALNRLSGNGTVYARVLKGKNVVFPESGEWYSFTGESGSIPALELGMNAGDTLTLQVYTAAEQGENIVVGLGTPVVQRLSNRVFTDTGNTTVYQPTDYIAFEEGYSGAVISQAARFNYSLTRSSGEADNIALSESETKKLAFDDRNYIVFESGSPQVTAEAGNTVTISFKSPVSGNAGVNIAATAISGAAQMRILKNGAAAVDWSTDMTVTAETELAAGDTLALEIKGDADYSLILNSFNITVQGAHNNQNTETDDAFYAVWANPYADDYYVGAYKEENLGYWKFKFYDAVNERIVNADSYSAKDSNKLYSAALDDIGYYFGNVNLTAELSGTDKGISLGFTAPRDDTFNFRFGLRLVTSGAKADLNLRMIHISNETGNASVIWGTENEWIRRTDVAVGTDVTIPYQEVTMAKGDTVYLQVYAASSNKEKLTLNLVSPAVIKETVAEYANTDIAAKLYWAGAYTPYSFFQYEGDYLPMENRWNFEFFDMTDKSAELSYVDPSYYKNTGSVTEIIWKRSTSWPFTNVSKNGQNITAGPAITSTDKTGVSHRFTSSVDGEVTMCATPSIPSVPAEMPDLKAYYRVIKINAADNTVTTVWPSEDNAEWEELDRLKPVSECVNLTVGLAKGDQLLFQFYIDAPSEQFEAYRARANAEKANSGNQYRMSISYTPVIVIPEHIEEDKRNHNVMAQWTADLQISPYWRYEYSESSENPVWKIATKQSWGYWMCATRNSMGVSNGARMWIENAKGSLDDLDTAAVAYTFTARTNGFITMGDSSIASMYGDSKGVNGRVRITVNGENVWPTSGWQLVTKDIKANPAKVNFEVKAGDKVRFEFSTENHLAEGESIRVLWNPSFAFDKYSNIYSQTSDIYNMLDSQMLEHFRAMDTTTEFDENPAASKAVSEKITARKAKALLNAMKKDEIFNIGGNKNENKLTVGGTPGDYSEWTEEIYTPGGGYRKIMRYITTSWWVYLLIVLVCVAVVAALVITFIILRKKGKLPIRRNKKIPNGGK